jgi:hypothetical protein
VANETRSETASSTKPSSGTASTGRGSPRAERGAGAVERVGLSKERLAGSRTP